MLVKLTRQLEEGKGLDAGEVAGAVERLVSENVSVIEKADFLCALADKGETADEIAAFVRELRGKAIVPELDEEMRSGIMIDVCGTGGDKQHTFNISTTVGLLISAAGVRVVKHGNRAITSRSGSADVLEALGVPTDLSPARAVESLRENNFAFFFAPQYHPAFKNIAPARKLCAERGSRTIFNFLGPLLNPVKPSVQLVGVPHPRWCEILAEALRNLGLTSAFVVSGGVEGGFLDELSPIGDNHIAGFLKGGELRVFMDYFEEGRFKKASISDFKGGSSDENAELIKNILRGVDSGPRRDAVVLNAGAALWAVGKAESMEAGKRIAIDLMDSGAAYEQLEKLVSGK
ncbi:MAG: anthranilate phosphoribosyltransferase [Verrucomicrobia bacterium]|nr:anthranilate phosphoribosyltransferase [Verrucomicrobiota bacterium]